MNTELIVENNEIAKKIAAEKKAEKAIKDKEIVELNSELKQNKLKSLK